MKEAAGPTDDRRQRADRDRARQFFADLQLTAPGGIASSALAGLFTAPKSIWNFAPNIIQPIFNSGRIRANLKLTEAQEPQAVLTSSVISTACDFE